MASDLSAQRGESASDIGEVEGHRARLPTALYAAPMGAVRPSAKAVIVEDNRLLLTRNFKPDEDNEVFWLLPGGGQNHQENLEDTLRREVIEETGLEVEVGRLLWVRDYIGANHEFSGITEKLTDGHALELMFECKVVGGELGQGNERDPGQLEAEWVAVEDLPNTRLFPKALAKLVALLAAGKDPGRAYLGDVN